MESSIAKLLRETYVEGVIHTHVSMIKPKGKYLMSREHIEYLWQIYCNMMKNDDNSGKFGIAETPQHYYPVLGDIDIKIEEKNLSKDIKDKLLKFNGKIDDHLYTEKHVKQIIELFQSVLRQILDECNDSHLICCLLEKKIYSIEKNGIKYYKNGMHIHFPNIFLSKTDQETHLIPRIIQGIKELEIFDDLGVEDPLKVFDAGIGGKPWLLYGCRKENSEPYLLTKIYDSELNEIDLEEAFKYYQIYDMKEQLININGRVKEFLPRILSIIPYARKINELKNGLESFSKERQNLKIKNVKKENLKTTVDENLRIAEKLLPMLAQYRAEEYNEWITIGWILYNISEGCQEGLDLWVDFSSKDETNFDENECITQWDKMIKKDYTIGTLKFYAKTDNPDLYREFVKEQGSKHIKASLEGSHYDIAKLLYTEYGTEFVCASVAGKTWYQFTGHYWEEIEEGVFLRDRISSDIVEKYGKLGGDYFAKVACADSDSTDEKNFQLRLKQIQTLVRQLKSTPFKRNVMTEAADIFYNKNFKIKLDTNPYLFGFRNGVYDLKLNIFRSGRPEDYISNHSPIDYINFSNSDKKVQDVNDFLLKVFPDTSVRKYFLDQASDIFVGGNHQKVVHFWTGEGDNGKSVTQSIFEKMLGTLAIKFSTTLITGKKTQIGAAGPELARAGGGVRFAVLEEPDADEEINIGMLKSLSGNDSYWARDLFEKGKTTREIQPLFKLIFICVDGDTKISLSNGVSFSIKNLDNNKQKLLSWDSKTNGFLNTSQHAFFNKGERECLRLTLLDGRTIICTPNHKLLTNNDEWIEAKDININTELKMGIDNVDCDDVFEDYNYILDCGIMKFNLSVLNDKLLAMAFSRLFGYMLTDGSLNTMLYIGHQIDCQIILDDIELLTNKRPKITKCNNLFKIEVPIELNKAFEYCCKKQIGGRVNNPMVLPSFIFDYECPLFIIREFIAAMFGGDGILPTFNRNNFSNIQLMSSKIEKYVDSLWDIYTKLSKVLFDRFEIETKIYKQEYYNIFANEHENTNDFDIKKFHIYININKKNSMLNFCNKIGIRYCCHKSYRIMALKSCLNYKNMIIKQNTEIIRRSKELYTKYKRQNKPPLIGQYVKNTNELIKIFDSTQKAQHATNINHSNIFYACERNSSSGGFSWKFIYQENEILDEPGCKNIKEAREKAILEYSKNNKLYNEYLITYSQLRRYLSDNIAYKIPSINLKKYLDETNLYQFCNQNKGKKYHHYSVSRDRNTLPSYNMRVFSINKIDKTQVYDINIDEPYSNFIANGIVTHNCNGMPAMKYSDQATWNRIRVIPFETTFIRPGQPCPSTLEEQLLEKKFPMDTEFGKKIPGLIPAFAWVLLEHRISILGKERFIPDKVKQATLLYRKQTDIYRQFIEERIIEDDKYIKIDELYDDFKEWFRKGNPGNAIPAKNNVKEYFIKLWNEPEKGVRWFGYRIRTIDDDIKDGSAIELNENDLVSYNENDGVPL